MNTDRFKFRVWYQPACDGIESRYFYDVESIYDGSIDGLGWISCFGDLLNDDQYIVEQCTGLKDKNGRLIYEGDLLGESKEDDEFIEICWCDTLASFMYDIFPETYGNLETCHADSLAKFEVIGNIHEMEKSK